MLFIFTVIVIATSSLLLRASANWQGKKISLFQCTVDVVNLLLNDNAEIRYQNLHRSDIFIVAPLTFTGLIVMNGIVSVFQSFITSPIYQPQINTLEGLYRSPVRILEPHYSSRDSHVEILEDITKYGAWLDKIHVYDKLRTEINTFNNSIAFCVPSSDGQVMLEVQKRLSLKAYHIMGDIFLTVRAFPVNSEYPYTEYINNILHTLNAGGFIDKWTNDRLAKYKEELWKYNIDLGTINNDSNVGDFEVPTIIWSGWIVSVAVFVCEIIWNRLASCKLKRKVQRRLQSQFARSRRDHLQGAWLEK